MNKEAHNADLYVADFTRYNQDTTHPQAPYVGVVLSEDDLGLIPSFFLSNPNRVPFEAVNIEHNPALLKREDGNPASQCECILYAVREAGPAWMIFLELKYCEARNVSANVKKGIKQAMDTYDFIKSNRADFFDLSSYRPYFIVSVPGIEDDPFDGLYIDQDDMIELRDNYGKAMLLPANAAEILTPVHVRALNH